MSALTFEEAQKLMCTHGLRGGLVKSKEHSYCELGAAIIFAAGNSSHSVVDKLIDETVGATDDLLSKDMKCECPIEDEVKENNGHGNDDK